MVTDVIRSASVRMVELVTLLRVPVVVHRECVVSSARTDVLQVGLLPPSSLSSDLDETTVVRFV